MRTDLPATWFRMYAEFATDPKVQMLSEADQRRFIMIMCLRCCNGSVTLQDSEVAFQLRISDAEYAITKTTLLEKGLIESDSTPTKWNARQFDSDTSNARVAKHRALYKTERKPKSNADVTLLKQKSNAPETETETEKKNTSAVAQPDGVSSSVWQDFQKLRKTKKATLTDTAMQGIVREAGKAGWGLEAALSECCARGWTGFKADWVAGKSASTGNENNFHGAMAGAI